MSRLHLLIALAVSLALPAAAQNSCDLQIVVTCTLSSCTSTTLNAAKGTCSGLFFSGFFLTGAATVSGFMNSLGLTDCIDSGIAPMPGQSFAYCFGDASLASGGTFTASAAISGGTAQVIGATGVFDADFNQKALVYAQSDVRTPTCTPTINAPPVTQSGLDYLVGWSQVSDPSAQFIVEEATDSSFNGSNSTTVNGLTKVYNHVVSTSTTYHYRVTATSCVGGTPQTSAEAPVVVQAPPDPKSLNPGLTLPLGTKQLVSFPVFIKGSGSAGSTALADPTYTAATDKPYLTVTPSSGTIPPDGTTVTVTAAPASLPPGASTGTLIITSNGTTTNTPVSISLVTPVSPEGKTLPPPNALIIPVVAHVNAAAGPFLSDVRLTNGSGSPMTYQVTMTPANTDGTLSSKATVVTVGAQETTALNDIVKNFFGFGATGAASDVGFGSLEIRPIDSGSLDTFAASRTYASLPNGTLGQFIAAIPFSKFATNLQPPIGLPSGPAITKLSLQQVAESTRFRTNFGLAEGAGEAATGVIRIFDVAGNDLKDVPFSLLPGEQQQLNGFIKANGIPTLTDGRLEVEITSPTGAVTAYASVLDNVTTDPLAVAPVNVSAVSSTRYILPGIAELNNGGNSNFHSDVRLFNGGAQDVTATLTFYPFAGFPGAAPKTLTIPHGQVAVLDNILPTFFNTSATGGSVVITTASPTSLVATARTYTNVENNGTYGQFIPGVTPPDGVANGDRALQVLQLEHSDRFRSNLGLVELTGNPVTVEVSLYQPDSKVTPVIEVPLGANEFRQMNGVIQQFLGMGTQTYNARISVKVTGGSGRVSAYGSVIDNQSADPTYVPAQ